MTKRVAVVWPAMLAQMALVGALLGLDWPVVPVLLAQLALTAFATWAAWPSLRIVTTRAMTARPAQTPRDEGVPWLDAIDEVPPVVIETRALDDQGEPLDQRLARAQASYRERAASETAERLRSITAAREERRARARARAARKAAARVWNTKGTGP